MTDVCRRLGHRCHSQQGASWEELEKQRSAAAGPAHVSPLVRFEAVQGLARAAAENTKKSSKPTPDMIARAADWSTIL